MYLGILWSMHLVLHQNGSEIGAYDEPHGSGRFVYCPGRLFDG
jgi:hypothetical protein